MSEKIQIMFLEDLLNQQNKLNYIHIDETIYIIPLISYQKGMIMSLNNNY